MSANTDTIRSLYEAVSRGDVPAVLAALDANVEWTEAEGFPYRGTYTGPDAVLNGVLARLGSEWAPFRVAPSEFIDGGEQVVTLGRYSGMYKATGKSFEADFAHVWTLRDGKVVRFRQYVDSALVQEALRN
jgi:ketosteroid isomerase-like protein